MAGLGDSILRTTAQGALPGDELKVGASVKRVHFSENRLTVAAINRQAGIIVLRREGGTVYVSRGTGSVYSPAVMIVCSFWVQPLKLSNISETWVREVCEVPVKKG